MSSALLLMVAAMTSLAASLLVRRQAPADRRLLRAALLVFELVGISTLFLASNLALAVAVVLAIRSFSPFFVSVYVLDDLALVALSLLQGAVFFFWRR
jgi:hypothetical protein